MRYKAVSLFSGAGGMDVGAKSAGFKTIFASELDAYACQTFRLNHPEIELIEGDINRHLPKLAGLKDVALVYGGPPCQGFSVAGKMNPSDPRSKLVFSFCDVVEMLHPNTFVMENVKALGSLAKFEDVRLEIIKRMHKAGYDVSIHILNAKEFGVPQSRERVFFIGVKEGTTPIKSWHFEEHKIEAMSLRKAIGHLGRAGSATNPNTTKAKITTASKPVLRKSPYAGMLFNGQGRPLNPDAWSSTLPASMGGNRTPIVDEDHLYDGKPSWVEGYHAQIMRGEIDPKYGEAPSTLRRLTIDEAAILQSFPDGYEFTGPQSRVFSQIGNAVPCRLAEVVFRVLKNQLDSPSGVSHSCTDMAPQGQLELA